MAGRPLISDVIKLIRYEPESGKLYWLPRGVEWFKEGKAGRQWPCNVWNGKFAGKEAFTAVTAKGYKQGNILSYHCEAHRLIWAIQTGEWPTLSIDHQNGDTTDNRWVNLRHVSHKENMRNMKTPAHNTSGHIGVSFCRTHNKWVAKIQLEKGRDKVRYCATKEEAIKKHAELVAKYNFHHNHGRKAA